MTKYISVDCSWATYETNRLYNGLRVRLCLLVCTLLTIGTISTNLSAAECVAHNEYSGTNPSGLPLLEVSDMEYAGAFRFPKGTYGASSVTWGRPIIEQFGQSIFIAGHSHHDAIAEFVIPELVNSLVLEDLNKAAEPSQYFATVIDRAPSGNPDRLDSILGMEIINGKLIINIIRGYDGSASNTNTTLILDDPTNLAGSSMEGFYHLPQGARSSGWISPVPFEWQSAIGATHITGNSSSTSINARHSVGPSAFALDAASLFSATLENPEIQATTLMNFPYYEALSEDINNEGGDNDLWTYNAGALYGFIVPGTRTYATFGALEGGVSGIGYKITRSDGSVCSGYCSYDPADNNPYYWFFNVDELLEVKSGHRSPSSLRPYDYGVFPAPFQPDVGANEIAGGTFDEQSGTLYLSLSGADGTAPVVVAYRFPEL